METMRERHAKRLADSREGTKGSAEEAGRGSGQSQEDGQDLKDGSGNGTEPANGQNPDNGSDSEIPDTDTDAASNGETGAKTAAAGDSDARRPKKRSRKQQEKTSWKAELLSWIQVIVSAAVIAFVLTTFIIANSEVPSGSMENTIMTGSRVIGSRLTYKFSDPERGDVAIFVFGWQCSTCGVQGEGEKPDTCPLCGASLGRRAKTIYYVKRVIGVPGDVIDIHDGGVYLNGSETPLDEPYIAEDMDTSETFHFEVPEGCYFMMGDNRNYSRDARYWQNPYISKDKMVAKVLFEYFPTPKLIH